MKNILVVLVALFLVNFYLYSQKNVGLSADLANNYIWRGSTTNTTPVLQPTLTFLPERTVSFGLWASTPITPTKKLVSEIDIFLDVQIASFLTLNITDYFVYEEGITPRYNNFKKDTTGHILDVQLIFAHDNFPLTMILSTILLGNDLNDSGKNNYSTYIECGYVNQIKRIEFELFVGMTPFKSVDFYEVDNISIINIGIGLHRTFKFNKSNYDLPISMKISHNPSHKKTFFTVSANIFNTITNSK